MEDDQTLRASPGTRSVSYPFIGLEEAVRRARTFYEAERRNAAPVVSAVEHWGYAEKSSGGRQTIAALIQFGLLMDEGSGEERKVRLTDLALDIVLDEDGTFRRKDALRAAAKLPKLYAELISQFPLPDLPSDQTLKYFLLREKAINANAVDACMRNFRETLRYSGLDQGEATEPIIQAPTQSTNPKTEPTNTTASVTRSSPNPPGASSLMVVSDEYREEVFSLDEGPVILRWPRKMSAASVDDFKSWIAIVVRKVERSAAAATEKHVTIGEAD